MNKLNFSNFYIKVTAITLIVLLFTLILKFVSPDFFITADFLTVMILYLTTLGLYAVVTKNYSPKQPQSFVNIFTSATIAKLFILMIYVVFIIFKFKDDKINFLIFLLFTYVIYTVLEVMFLIKHMKNNKE